ncbi:NUDIX domain-containing protein [Moritella sp. Urea-trap-13]|uniref:NUDIX domain-containing protein n=1 Tax=Moritella sp. Urea-trap-13 TaxID=2058327 RepID=UPI000C32E3B7|nr:NUDIX domain-containing protein [Moritella sp. Urea-trap-13]PKH08040.1 DNA mismatch repair protein MutT [Moritella sp. Urea-trap-13]
MFQDVVQIIFIKGSQVLLAYRQNTEFLDQQWSLPGGRIELGEHPQVSALRESLEEVGVEPINLCFLAQLSDPNVDCQHYVYVCDDWQGELINAEPHLCREVRWFALEAIPHVCAPTIPPILAELKRYLE